MSTPNGARVVSREEFEAAVAAAFENVERIETPAADKNNLARLLGVPANTVGSPAAGFPNGNGTCTNCDRAFTFLDIAATALKVHSREFLVGVMTGRHGYLVGTGSQPFNCYECPTRRVEGEREMRSFSIAQAVVKTGSYVATGDNGGYVCAY
ncbi:hypothetical protein C8R45DRAFT_1022439 [Mycena sanguinolenta]|nr:hypothetical protein C8R45DRAFT_1022439 [Mycena sanguinolenta]